MKLDLRPEKAWIFRITHAKNMPWILRNGLHCPSSTNRDPGFVTIGNPDIIGKRASRAIPVSPGGYLEDYVPFYFTPCSPMLYNIKTGYNGIPRRDMDDIVVLASSLSKLVENEVPFVFTDRHALVGYARFFSDVSAISNIDWELISSGDFSRSDDLGKVERYQAEALAYRHVPTAALLGVACYSGGSKERVEGMLDDAGVDLKVIVQRDWFFG